MIKVASGAVECCQCNAVNLALTEVLEQVNGDDGPLRRRRFGYELGCLAEFVRAGGITDVPVFVVV